jgi:hypothetical protein
MAKGRIIRQEPNQSLQLPRVGMIKTGFKNEKGFPQSTDYFIATGKYSELFNREYPNKPSTIQVVFWDDDPETMCQERFEYRDAQGKLYASGDGENFKVWNSTEKKYQDMNIVDVPNLMEQIHKKVNYKGWSVILTLRFLLPKVKDIAGFWEFNTKGEASTIPAIRDMFDAMLMQRGSVRGVIFDLNVVFAKSQKPGVGSRYPVVNLVPNQSKENIQALKGSMMNVEEPKQLNQ